MEEAQKRPLPTTEASGGAGAAPPPKTTAPASWRLTLPWITYLGITWDGLVGGWVRGRGHREGQLRVGARQPPPRSALRNPRQGAHQAGGESADQFLRKPIDTYLGALKPACVGTQAQRHGPRYPQQAAARASCANRPRHAEHLVLCMALQN
jgi:hypothetical protein